MAEAPIGAVLDRRLAHCRGGGLIALFFSDDPDDIAVARTVCQGCPLARECLAGAIARREPCGVWGGELFMNGTILAVKRRRGRPRKEEYRQPA